MMNAIRQYNDREVEQGGTLVVLTEKNEVRNYTWNGPVGPYKGRKLGCARLKSVKPKPNGKKTWWSARKFDGNCAIREGDGFIFGIHNGFDSVVPVTREASAAEIAAGSDPWVFQRFDGHSEYLRRFTGD